MTCPVATGCQVRFTRCPDGNHASAAGHRLIADLLEDSLTRPYPGSPAAC
ncbi:MAG: hypothetical protein JWN87_1889 [Frankiales bacterium]|nr:hypothetical protein [Frankiales bacterium]